MTGDSVFCVSMYMLLLSTEWSVKSFMDNPDDDCCSRFLCIRVYAVAFYRVEYDAYRSDLEALQAAPRVGDATAAQKLEDAQQRYQTHKEKFERLRSDVSIKMKFLDENRVINSLL